MTDHGPVEEKYNRLINGLAGGIIELLAEEVGDNSGFVLLLFDLNDDGKGRMNYASNARKEDVIQALEELVRNMRGDAH